MRCYVLDLVKALDDLKASEPIDRATWLMLISYCCFFENGGVIKGARQWGERRWFGSVCVTKAEVERESLLWEWVGDDLHVKHYNEEAEENWKLAVEARKKRKAANARWMREQRRREAEGAEVGEQRGQDVDMQENLCMSTCIDRGPEKGKDRRGEDRLGKERIDKERGGEATAAPPPPFPKTVEEALKLSPGYDPEFVRTEWRKAAMRGNLDFQGNAIINWPLYLEDQHAFRASRAKAARTPQNITALEEELGQIKNNLRALPRYAKDIFPAEYDAVQRQAQPLRERKAEIERILGGAGETRT